MQALVNARLQEQNQHEAAVAAAVAARLDYQPVQHDRTAWPLFKGWCEQKAITPFPARPASVAYFILDNVLLGIEGLEKVIEGISAVHDGVADPTLSPMVSAAFHQVAPIDPPRSWPKEHKQRFLSLPRELQTYVVARETQRDKEVTRAQNEAAKVRQKLLELQRSPRQETADGIQQNATA